MNQIFVAPILDSIEGTRTERAFLVKTLTTIFNWDYGVFDGNG